MGVSKGLVLIILLILIFGVAHADLGQKIQIEKPQAIAKHIFTDISANSFSSLAVSPDDYEYDNEPGYASSIPTNGSIQTHTFHTTTDVDWVKFNCVENESYNITTNDSNIYIQVYGSSLNLVSFNYYYNGSEYVIKSPKDIFYCDSNETIYVKLEYSYYSTATYTLNVINTTSPVSERDNAYFNSTELSTNGTKISKQFSFFSNDKDYFKFNAIAGNIYVIETYNKTPGTDTYLTLYNTNGMTVIKENDDDSIYLNSRIVWNCTSDGTYYASVWDRYGKGGNYTIRVYKPTITQLQADGTPITQSFNEVGSANYTKFSAVAGTKYIIKTQNITTNTDTYLKLYNASFSLLKYDDDTYFTGVQNANSLVTWYAPTNGTYYIEVSDYYIKSGQFNVSVNDTIPPGPSDSFEPDDYFTDANWSYTNNTLQSHSFYYYGESDFVKFNATAGKTYIIKTNNPGGRIVDTYLILYYPNYSIAKYNDDVGSCSLTDYKGCLSEIDFKPTINGTYYIEVWDISSAGGNYTLSVVQNGTLNVNTIYPLSSKNVSKNGLFEYTVNISCNGGYCGNVNATLDPTHKNNYIPATNNVKNFEVSPNGQYIILLKGTNTNSQKGFSINSMKSNVKSLQDKFLSTSPNIKVIHKYSTLNIVAVELTPPQLDDLKGNPYVADVVPNRVFHAALNESVPQIRANDTWDIQYHGVNITGVNQTVCILDSGVNYTHPNLAHAYFNNSGYDFCNGVNCNDSYDADPMDEYGHGTHVAGIIVSNDTTYRGVAPDAKFVPVKVMNATGSGTTESILAGIDWCVSNATKYNISVITMSLGSDTLFDSVSSCEGNFSALTSAINNATNAGLVVVAASGNDGSPSGISAPACIGNVISVGAVDKNDTVADYSNVAPILDVLAPGTNIYSTMIYNSSPELGCYSNSDWCYLSGTSMAAPHVAGAILLMDQYNKMRMGSNLDKDAALKYLKDYGVNVTDKRKSVGSGLTFPRIDVYASVLGLKYKGIVPMDSGSPFFTTTHPQYTNTSQNPIYSSNLSCLQNMQDGDYCLVTWVINASGQMNTTWDFFVKLDSDILGDVKSATDSISIVPQNVVPDLKVYSPIDGQSLSVSGVHVNISAFCNTSLVSTVGYQLTNSTGSVLRSGNLSKVEATNYWDTTIPTVNLPSGMYNLTITAVNSLGNSTSVVVKNLTVDATYPSITINSSYPQNTTTPWLNITVSDDTNVSSVWYNLNGGSNTTLFYGSMTPVVNNTAVTLNYPGWNYFVVYANDTSGNLINRTKEFYEISQMNTTKWIAETNASAIYPNGASVWNNQTFNITLNSTSFNVTLVDVNGTNVWWDYNFAFKENDSQLNNITSNYGMTPYLTLYLDKNLIKDKICEENNCTDLLNADYAKITFSPNSSGYDGVYSCGRGIPDDFSSCVKLNACTTNNVDCYTDSSTETTVYVNRFSTLVVVNDTTPPDVIISSPEDKVYTSCFVNTNVSSSHDVETCTYSLDGASNVSLNKSNEYFISTLGPLKNGNHNITVYCVDSSGNYNSSYREFTIYDDTPPSLNGVYVSKSNSSATIHFKTDEYAKSTVYLYRKSDCSDLRESKNTDWGTTHSAYFSGLSSSYTYYYQIIAEDYQGNVYNSTCYNFTTSAGESGNENNEAGASGGNTTQQNNEVVSEVFFWQSLEPNKEIDVDVKSSAIAVDMIKLYLSNLTTNAQLTVKSSGDTPPFGIPGAPGVIYQYFTVSTNFDSEISSMHVDLRVPVSWFISNGYNPNNVTVYHYYNNSWVPEFTSYKGTSGDNYLYAIDINHLSAFAVTSVKLVEYCGNGICNQTVGENCSTCEADCGLCLSELPIYNTEGNTSNNITEVTHAGTQSNTVYIVIGVVVIVVVGFLAFQMYRRENY